MNTFTAVLLIIVPIAFNVIFLMLGRNFEYPGILRQPTGQILTKFRAGGSQLVALWYAFALTALMFVPLSLLVGAVFADESPLLAGASALVGAFAGLVQGLGLLRWVFLVPTLAAQHETGSESQRAAAETVFLAFHQYAGVAIGEHLGYLFTAGWTILLSLIMFSLPSFGAVIAIIGMIGALGILAGVFEHIGWEAAAAVNAISYIVWSLWLIAVGVMMLLGA